MAASKDVACNTCQPKMFTTVQQSYTHTASAEQVLPCASTELFLTYFCLLERLLSGDHAYECWRGIQAMGDTNRARSGSITVCCRF